MSRPGIEPGPPGWEARALEKSHSNSLFIAIQNIYMSARPVENTTGVITKITKIF
jgi:hypothetical protein